MTEHERIDNVLDRRYDPPIWRSFDTIPVPLPLLSEQLVGKSVVYRDVGRSEVGTVTSVRSEQFLIFARYSTGDTAAAAGVHDLRLVLRSVPKEKEL